MANATESHSLRPQSKSVRSKAIAARLLSKKAKSAQKRASIRTALRDEAQRQRDARWDQVQFEWRSQGITKDRALTTFGRPTGPPQSARIRKSRSATRRSHQGINDLDFAGTQCIYRTINTPANQQHFVCNNGPHVVYGSSFVGGPWLHSQCVDCGLGTLARLLWYIRERIYRGVIAGLGDNERFTLMHSSIGFCPQLRLYSTRAAPPCAAPPRNGFLDTLLSAK
ncbi:hypothetical protein BKA63DRAFT_491873 [Paraphoma chrysanthemicola]|nr:hypothetical protein BKA63DRAFT_491873 [Paraphoma chrysanthemicola]